MREIKYRVWHTKDKYMSTVAGLDWTIAGLRWYGPGVGEGWCYLDPDFDWTQKNCNPKPEQIHILMEFTGLKDCKGVEVYEGDIVKWDTPDAPHHKTRNLQVVFNHKYSQFCLHPCIWIGDTKDKEVIGNIHESPELIKNS